MRRPELRALADTAAAVGARRAQVTEGTLGLHAQISEMPPGYEVPPHRHSAHELMVVLEGGCAIHSGPSLSAGDIVEIPADTEYGFNVGDDGIRFLVVRPKASTTKISEEKTRCVMATRSSMPTPTSSIQPTCGRATSNRSSSTG